MLEQVGGFDDTYFAFFEDVDLAWRARAHGWRTLYAPQAVVYHHHSATARHGSPAKLYLVGRNRVRTLAKNASVAMLLRNAPRMVLYELGYVVFTSLTTRNLAPLQGPRARPARMAWLPAPRRRLPTSDEPRPTARLPARAAPTPDLASGRPRQPAALSAIRMRAAVVHDWFQGFHGSERTVAAMLDLFEPDPDVFTFHAARELLPDRLARAIVRESRLAALPGIRQRGHDPGRWRWLLPYMPLYFSRLDLGDYDLVVSSSHACAAGVQAAERGAPRLLLLHADALRLDAGRGARPRRVASRAWRWPTLARPSAGVGPARVAAPRRLRRHLVGRGRADQPVLRSGAVVVHPPVTVADFPWHAEREPGHFLWVHRLVPYKRPLEVAAAFRDLPDYRLTMVGVGPLEAPLRESLPPNVELHGWLPREELVSLTRALGLHPCGRGGLRHHDGRGARRGRARPGRGPRRSARHRAARLRRCAHIRPARPGPAARGPARAGRRSVGSRPPTAERRALLGGAVPGAPCRGAP